MVFEEIVCSANIEQNQIFLRVIKCLLLFQIKGLHTLKSLLGSLLAIPIKVLKFRDGWAVHEATQENYKIYETKKHITFRQI